jgi:pimeloyl-ACP methyl ester carboxylesterase
MSERSAGATCQEMNIETTRFEITSSEGLPIRGVLQVPHSARALVVVLHGFKGFMEWGFFPWLTERLAENGLATCRFDFSRNGVGSSGDQFDRLDLFADDTYSQELRDVDSVIGRIEGIDAVKHLPIALLGHSRGGAVAILAAARVPRIRSVVTWAAISSVDRWDEATKAQWRKDGFLDIPNARTGQIMRMSTRALEDVDAHREELDVLAAVGRLEVPLLVLHGGRDESVAVDDAHQIAAASHNASLMIIGNASHTFGAIHPLVRVPQELDLATEVTGAFLLNTARSPRTIVEEGTL